MREILKSNDYPTSMVESKIKTFLENDQKPPRENLHHTITLNYTSHRVDKIISSLVFKMKKILPKFSVNMSFRSVKLTKFFSCRAKPRKNMFETTNCVYQFQCPCSSSYIGMSDRRLPVRIKEHHAPKGHGIYHHLIHCNLYKSTERKYLKDSKIQLNAKSKDDLKFEYFKSQFKIIQKNFGSYFERRNSEAFHIRVQKPDLNDQRDHLFFKLIWIGQLIFLVKLALIL